MPRFGLKDFYNYYYRGEKERLRAYIREELPRYYSDDVNLNTIDHWEEEPDIAVFFPETIQLIDLARENFFLCLFSELLADVVCRTAFTEHYDQFRKVNRFPVLKGAIIGGARDIALDDVSKIFDNIHGRRSDNPPHPQQVKGQLKQSTWHFHQCTVDIKDIVTSSLHRAQMSIDPDQFWQECENRMRKWNLIE